MEANTNRTLSGSMTQKDDQRTFPKTLLLIPTLNEENAIAELVDEARAYGFGNIMVIDGFSTDKTRERAETSDVKVVLQDFGKGKGCGVRTGMRDFLQTNAEIMGIIDGDGTCDTVYFMQMITILENGQADVVLGSRTRGPREPQAMNFVSLASNRTVSFMLGAKFRRLFTDIQTGQWVFTRDAVERIYPKITSTGFEIELELFVKLMKEGLRVLEIPVAFRRRKGKTKFKFSMRIRNLYYAFKFLAS